jgi:hypothetical protein
MKKNIRIHYHAPYFYQQALESAKSDSGILAVIASVTAVESLIGDIRLTYSSRQDIVLEMEKSNRKSTLFKNKAALPNSVEAIRLTEFEVMALDVISIKINKNGNPDRKPTLNLLYQLAGCKGGEQRDTKEFNKNNQRDLLPSAIVDLFDLRHSIIHRDGFARIESDSEENSKTGNPPSVERLITNGIIQSNIDIERKRGWLGLIDNRTVGEWSVSTVGKFIKQTLEGLPSGSASDYLRENAMP